jgi:riboflavin kinase/FMN adenylyltransferase
LALLKKLGEAHGFNVIGVQAVQLNGEVVSSTAIRQAVEAGDLVKATQMLGREYTILGTVVRGEQLGRKLGFPTANLSAHSEQFPPNGVYVVEARLAGALHRGVANLGFRPTIAAAKPERLLELHLFDLDREIYGEEIEVRFVRYLRPEQKFADVEALKAQIAADVRQARESFSILP